MTDEYLVFLENLSFHSFSKWMEALKQTSPRGVLQSRVEPTLQQGLSQEKGQYLHQLKKVKGRDP